MQQVVHNERTLSLGSSGIGSGTVVMYGLQVAEGVVFRFKHSPISDFNNEIASSSFFSDNSQVEVLVLPIGNEIGVWSGVLNEMKTLF